MNIYNYNKYKIKYMPYIGKKDKNKTERYISYYLNKLWSGTDL